MSEFLHHRYDPKTDIMAVSMQEHPFAMHILKLAIRRLGHDPIQTGVAILLLSVGIGATTAIYGTINSVLLHPIPESVGKGLIQIAELFPSPESPKPYFEGVTPPVLKALRAHENQFEELTWYHTVQMLRDEDSFRERTIGSHVAPGFFEIWNTQPVLGRPLTESDAVAKDKNGTLVRGTAIMLSDSGWRDLFERDPNVVGKPLRLDGIDFNVAGVMPERFQFPLGSGGLFWIPVKDPAVYDGIGTAPNYQILARLKPGVQLEQVQTMLDGIAARLQSDPTLSKTYGQLWRNHAGGLQLGSRPASDSFFGRLDRVRPIYWGLIAAISVVLLIVCLNLANLSIVRIGNRTKELAVRSALGASRSRLIGELLTESLLLAIAGGALGLLIADWGIQLLTHFTPRGTPRVQAIEIDSFILGLTFLLSIGSGIIIGIIPALRGTRFQPSESLKETGATVTTSRKRGRLVAGVIVAEVALTVTLLLGAGLMIRTVANLMSFKPGYDAQNLIRVHVDLPWQKYGKKEQFEARNLKITEIHQALSALPGIQSVGMDDWIRNEKFRIDSTQMIEAIDVLGCGVAESDPFAALKVPLVQGRLLNHSDIQNGNFFQLTVQDGVSAVVINEAAARLFPPNESPLGQTFRGSTPRSKQIYRVVGVVRDFGYTEKKRPQMYRPVQESHRSSNGLQYLVRTHANPTDSVNAIRQSLAATEPQMTSPKIILDRQVRADETIIQRTFMAYLVSFAAFGLILALLGLYGIITSSVAQRTHEIGIRMAVGAQRRQVTFMILSDGIRLVSIGLVGGLVVSYWTLRLIQSFLFQVNTADPTVLATVVSLLFVAGSVACIIPAIRASASNPLKALRQ